MIKALAGAWIVFSAMTALQSAPVSFKAPKDIAGGSVSGVSCIDAGKIDNDALADVVVIEGGKHAGGRKTFAWFKSPSNPQNGWTRRNISHGASLRSFLGSAKLADFDNDGDLDLAVSSDNHSGGSKQADVLVFLNPGGAATGTWTHHRVTPSTMAWHHLNDMEIVDLDRDGKKDIVVRSLDPNQIHIFFQNSVSSWTRKTINTGISQSEGLSVGQIDGDGRPDITFTGYWLKTPSNARTGTYTQNPIDSNYKNTNQNTKEATGDIDGDGRIDVVIGPAEAFRGGGNHVLAWYKNPGSNYGSNWQRNVIRSNTNNHHTVKLADIDNDGDLDVVTGKPWSASGIPKESLIFYNNGSGGFGTVQTLVSGKGLYTGVAFDIGNDGDLDIVGQDSYSGSSKPWLYESTHSSSTPTVPAAPGGLTATTASESRINLNWTDNANNEDGFRIQRAASSSGPWSQIASVGANATSYANTGLTASTTYYYRVRAYNVAGNSNWSNTANATTLAPPLPPPAAPSGLTASAVSESRIDLDWTDNANNEDGFRIQRAASSSGPWSQIASVGAGVTSYSNTGLSVSTTYYYRVRAYNAAGNSSWSNTANATTSAPPLSPPAAPGGLVATPASESRIDLDWTDNANNEDGFQIQRAASSGGPWSQIASVGAGVTSYSNTGLTASTAYYYRVRAFNGAGNSGWSNTANATTLAPPVTPPAAPSGLSATAASSSRIDLAWTDNANNEDGFRIERSTGGGFSLLATVGSNATSYADTGLAPSTNYSYRVRANNSAGNSTWSNTANATTFSGSITLPAPWQTQDIGAVGAAGDASIVGETFTIDGSGADIWSTADEFRYVYQDLSGDGSVIARLISQGNTNGWAKAGPMIRESVSANSKHAIMAITPSNGATYDRRTSTGGTTSKTVVAGAAPIWVRLTRVGDLLTGYVSSDGVVWTSVDQVTVSMGTNVLAGLAVTSHNDGAVSTAVFDGVMVTSGADTDGDGMADGAEAIAGYDAFSTDEDGNGVSDGQDDWDGDGVLNHAELSAGTPAGAPPGGGPAPGPGPGPGPGPSGNPAGGSKGSACGTTGAEALLLLMVLWGYRRMRK